MGYTNEGGWDLKQDEGLTTSSGAEDGSGGGVMDIWTADRQTKVRQLSKVPENNAEFDIPSGFVDQAGWDVSFEATEKKFGVNASGQPLEADGRPFAGTASIEAGGLIYNEKDVVGGFIIAAPPPEGVTEGQDVELDEYNLRFSPSTAGIDYYQENIGLVYEAGAFRYGAIEGTLTDYEGDPVEGEPIFGEGEGDKTDASGYYRLVAPGGTTVTLAGLGYTKDRTPSGGETLVVDWQFARLEIEVVTPDLEPVTGTTVQVGQEQYETDEDGLVVVDPAYIVDYDILVSNEWLIEVAVQEEGDLYQERIGDANKTGVDVTLIDGSTGEPIQGLPGLFSSASGRAKSNRQGHLRIFTDDDSEDALALGFGDPRYQDQVEDVSLTIGETASKRVVLDRRAAVVNT